MTTQVRGEGQVARAALREQTNESGFDGAAHRARVAARVGVHAQAHVVAWLPDVLDAILDALTDLSQRLRPAVVDAVHAITQRPPEPAAQHSHRLAANPRALRVTLTDQEDKNDPQRPARLEEPTRARSNPRYAATRATLTSVDV